ncbi:glycosyltransferase family 4 protein [Enterovibrio makurazakiensis]|uniref:glycosyltransferase family 4 protein n=1 Tax=Enterovibrio makurazakiensis TaxID=2910232 RepID=UPI003D235DD6
MKIAFLLNSLSIGGSERKIINIANRISEKGWSVSIIYISGSSELQGHIDESIDVIKLRGQGDSIFIALRKSYDYIIRKRIETIFTVNMYPLVFAFIPKLSLGKKLRMVSLTNTTYFECFKKKFQMLIYRLILSLSDHIVFGAQSQMTIWNRKYLLGRIPSSVIYNGVDTDRFSNTNVSSDEVTFTRDNLAIEGFDFTFCTVAQLRIEKRHIDIIEACEYLKKNGINVACLFVGGSSKEYKETLKVKAKINNVAENIKFIGQVNDCRPYLLASDCFLLASESETFSNATLEAMSLSLPVLITNVGGAPEMVDEDINGFLFEPLNPKSLAEKMELVISRNNDQLGNNAREKVTTDFSYKSMVKSYMEISHHD